MSEQKTPKPGMKAGLKTAEGYYNANVFPHKDRSDKDILSVAVNTPDKKSGFADLHSKTAKNGAPYMSGVATIDGVKLLVKIDQIKTGTHNFLTLGISKIGGTQEEPTFTSVSERSAALYANELAQGSVLESQLRAVFQDLPQDAFKHFERAAENEQKAATSNAPAAEEAPAAQDAGAAEAPQATAQAQPSMSRAEDFYDEQTPTM